MGHDAQVPVWPMPDYPDIPDGPRRLLLNKQALCAPVVLAVKEGDVATAWKVLERIDRRLAPPRQLHGVEHSGDVTRSVREMSDEELRERVDRLGNRWAAHDSGAHTNGRCLPPPTP